MWGQIHWGQIQSTTVGNPDVHGRGGTTVTAVEVHGRMELVGSHELDIAERFTEAVRAVFQCPPGSPVTLGDTFNATAMRLDGVTPTGIPAELQGVYVITALRLKGYPGILRVMLRRTVG